MRNITCEHIAFSGDKWSTVYFECVDRTTDQPEKVRIEFPFEYQHSPKTKPIKPFKDGKFKETWLRYAVLHAVTEVFSKEEAAALKACNDALSTLHGCVPASGNPEPWKVLNDPAKIVAAGKAIVKAATPDTFDAWRFKESILYTCRRFSIDSTDVELYQAEKAAKALKKKPRGKQVAALRKKDESPAEPKRRGRKPKVKIEDEVQPKRRGRKPKNTTITSTI